MINATKRAQETIIFDYHVLRNISAPEDTNHNRRVYSGTAPIQSFIGIPEDENVRTYIVTAEGKKRQRLTEVHRRIRDTLQNQPEEFVVLNSGITIVARDIVVNEKDKQIKLIKPSIINGSQTRGEIDYYVRKNGGTDLFFEVSCKYEIIVTADDELIADVSIARNFQNDVATLSIAGRRGVLDELEQRLQSSVENIKLRKSETERSDDYHDTEKLIQVIIALTPAELWPKVKERDDPKKVFTYSMKAKCLKEFQDVFNAAKEEKKPEADLYKFYIDIAPEALHLYEKWKKHNGFIGTGLRAIQRENREVVDVPDGIVFPIIASLSAFAKQVRGEWKIVPPAAFTDNEIIHAAKAQYINVANSSPWIMGKNQAIYSSLLQITNIYQRLSK